VLQTGAGGQRVVDSVTGRIVHERARPGSGWLRPPLAVAQGRLCLVPRADRAVLFNPSTGKNLWTYKTSQWPGSTAPTGEAPYLLGNQEALLVLVPRNYGYQLERLDVRTGRPVWREKARLLREALTPELVSLDRRAVYYVDRKVLCARS